MATNKLTPQDIAAEEAVIHPVLDWRDATLFMGIRLSNGERGVITSSGHLLPVDELPWPICDRSRNFDRSPVTESVAQKLQSGYGTAAQPESQHALLAVAQQLANYYRRFVVFAEPWWADLLAFWTLGTYLYPIFSTYPYLRISSPEPGCGKSLLGEIIADLSFNGELMVCPTEANIFRLAESERGTQVWDEVENHTESDRTRLEVMKSALLNGYRAGGVVLRQERSGKGQFVGVRFHVYVPRVLIGLSELPPVVQQRTIEVCMHRRSTEDKVERYLPDERAKEEQSLREICAQYALRYCGAVSHQYRRNDLAKGLESHLGQAGRLTDDLLLPLIAVCAAPISDQFSREAVIPSLKRLFYEVAPALSRAWNEGATTTPSWLAPALEILEEVEKITPAELAREVHKRAGIVISAEALSRGMKKYGIQSGKNNGARIFQASDAKIAQIRSRYRIADPGKTEAESPDSPPKGQ